MTRLPYTLCMPTFRPGDDVYALADAVARQTHHPERFIVVDSTPGGSGSLDPLQRVGAEIWRIRPEEFDHGAVRQWMADQASTEIVAYLTQDAVPADPDALNNLIAAFEDPRVGHAYGRQVAPAALGMHAAQHRHFNYPERSRTVTSADIPTLGIRAAFSSDSFSAYTVRALRSVGGFDSPVVFGEDTLVAAKMLKHGWAVRYEATAVVWHGHTYTLIQELRRYFDLGVMHAREPWYLEFLGRPTGEGIRSVLEAAGYHARRKDLPGLVGSFARSAARAIGYTTGRRYMSVPKRLIRRLSGNAAFWHHVSSYSQPRPVLLER